MDAPNRLCFVNCGLPAAECACYRDMMTYPVAENGRLTAERDRLIGALRAVEADCLDRAKFSRDGKTVPIGDGAWRELCAALASIKEADNG